MATHERTFFTHEQADAWRKYAFANFFPEPKTPLKECPPPKAVVLQRREGMMFNIYVEMKGDGHADLIDFSPPMLILQVPDYVRF